jgi:flagellar L-ring protein precursor FlgH
MSSQSKSSDRLIESIVIFLVLLISILMLPVSLRAQQVGSDGSFFTDFKAHGVGDLLTVLIFEDAQASNESQMQSQEKSGASTSSTGGVGPLKFIPLFSADNANDVKYDGKGTNTRRGSLKARMTVEVVAVRTNGDLAISGSRVIAINSEQETMTLSGIVRRVDVNLDNTINSYSIANAKINYTGKGPASDGSKPGVITRVLNWIF